MHPEIHNQYITHHVLESESESHKNKDTASLLMWQNSWHIGRLGNMQKIAERLKLMSLY